MTSGRRRPGRKDSGVGYSGGTRPLENIIEGVEMKHSDRERRVPKKDDIPENKFMDVSASLEALNDFVERPPSRKGLPSDKQTLSLPDQPTEDEETVMLKAGVAAVAARPKKPTPPPKDPPKEGSTAPKASAWSAVFSGTSKTSPAPKSAESSPGATKNPGGSSISRPMPFIESGQVTYVGETQYKAEMKMIIFWDTEKVWGQFTISDGSGHGYLRSGFKPEWEPIKDGETVEFHWRGCGGRPGLRVPSKDDEQPECTKVTIKFSKDSDKIEGEMHPMDRKGRANWHMGGGNLLCIEDKKFTFSGLRQTESKGNEKLAWDGWDKYGQGS